MLSIIVLGFIQGITEFLPISSSAHLIIFRDLFLIGKNVINNNITLTFDIALHFGTALAILVYFFHDFIEMKKKHIINIIIATIPAGLLGVLFEEIFESYLRTKYLIISLSLIIMGIIIYKVDKSMKENKGIEDITIKDALIIGISQIFALIPGFSRSGTTIVSARLLKINREDSAKFSFYLSLPIVLGAVILNLFKADYQIIKSNILLFILGILVSFTTGIICIKYLIKYLKNNNFKIFMWYRLILGLLVMIYLFFFIF